MTRTDPRPDLTKDAVLAPSDAAIDALATAMWDAVHTVRLSEHPEETEPMIERAKATARWLGRLGWSVVRSDAIAQAEQAATERATVDDWQPIETAPHNRAVLLGWADWRDGRWCMEVGAASWGERQPNGYSNRSQHGSATHWHKLPAWPAIRARNTEEAR